jgi:AcrR family transcriptional regulator
MPEGADATGPPARRTLELTYARGVEATGVDAIAEHARVTKRTLYRQFGSKEGPGRAALAALDEPALATLTAATDRRIAKGDRPVDALFATLRGSSPATPTAAARSSTRASRSPTAGTRCTRPRARTPTGAARSSPGCARRRASRTRGGRRRRAPRRGRLRAERRAPRSRRRRAGRSRGAALLDAER